MKPGSFRHSAGRIVPLAWPVLVGQVSVLAFGTVDTVLVARHSTADLAALAVGGAAYITVFIGLMGIVLALSPIVGHLYGAKRLPEAGAQLHQAIWLALGLSLLGSSLLAFPAPFLALSHASPDVAAKVRGYLLALALALPASLLFTAFRAFNTAVSRPKAVMALQLATLGLKVPLSMALVFGIPSAGVPTLGVVGCGVATAISMWIQVAASLMLLRHDAFYTQFNLSRLRRLHAPHRASLLALLKLGVPIGGSVLIEVSAFSFMAIFIARLGTTPVAGHQLAMNLVSLLFMVPMALSNACLTLVAQSIGARDLRDARLLAWHGWQFTLGLAVVLGLAIYLAREPVLHLYTDNPAVIAAALPLLTWLALFHPADAMQTFAAFVLRAWRIVTLPMVIYAVALWGAGLGGGYLLAFAPFGDPPLALRGAVGFWTASTAGLLMASVGLSLLLFWVLRQSKRDELAGQS